MKRKPTLLFVFHDTGLTGANLVLYRYICFLARMERFNLAFIVGRKGPLYTALCREGAVCVAEKQEKQAGLFMRVAKRIARTVRAERGKWEHLNEFTRAHRPALIYCNTVLTIPYIKEVFQKTHCKILLHVHELQLAYDVLEQDIGAVKEHVTLFVANSHATAEFLREHAGIPEGKIRVHYPAAPEMISTPAKIDGIKEDRFVVGSCGTGLGRKGAFLFIQLAAILKRKAPGAFQLVWIGNVSSNETELRYDIRHAGLEEDVLFTGEVAEPIGCYRSLDVFVSLSKEESFGLACLEAAALGIPLYGFEGTGGGEELIRVAGGGIIPYLDLEAFADALVQLKDNPGLQEKMQVSAKEAALTFRPEIIIPGWIDMLSGLAADDPTPGK